MVDKKQLQTKKGFLDEIYYKKNKQRDFFVCGTYEKDGETKFTKWKKYLDCVANIDVVNWDNNLKDSLEKVVEPKQTRIKSEDEIDEEMENRGIPSNLTPEEEQAIEKIQSDKDNDTKPTHSIKKITKPLDYDFLKKLSGGRFWDGESALTFYIGTECKLRGRVIQEIDKFPKKINLIKGTRKPIRDGDLETRRWFFTDKIPRETNEYVSEVLDGEFYQYKFITKDRNYIVFSEDKLGVEDYFIKGTLIEASDFLELSKSLNINIKTPLLFVNKAIKEEVRFSNHKEFKDCFSKYNLDEKKFFDWLYTSPRGWVYEFPRNFCLVQMANLLATEDEFDNFHLPLMVIGETGVGKTLATELIHGKVGEDQSIIDLTGTTLKGLIPSFKSPTDIQHGHLLEARRHCVVDEFFQGISNLSQDEKTNTLETIKNILDYKQRDFKSGHGMVSGKMKADLIVLTNPKNYGGNIMKLSKHFLPECLARFFVWFVSKQHKDFCQLRKTGKLQKAEESLIDKKDFQAGLDYLKTFTSEFDKEKVKVIWDIGEAHLKLMGDDYDKVRSAYQSRYLNHAWRLIDGIVKLRCWVTGNNRFKATEEDYKLLLNIWFEMLENWDCGFMRWKYKEGAKEPSEAKPQHSL